jgi:hypothetical protein
MGNNIDRYCSIAYIGGMKTTIDISDNLLNRARELARREKTTLKDLAEEGLQLVLSRRGQGSLTKIEPVIVHGQGLSSALKAKAWAEIRDEIYRGYGS